uniref:Ig-like domain-containing protein n=1 Tax=Suricata suricatta TaxID=37032 RepID=A0A673TDK1_SURSU
SVFVPTTIWVLIARGFERGKTQLLTCISLKSLIQWEKDGRCLQNSKRLGITKSGSLKIHSVAAPDIGTYRCVAGPARETVVLKLIGTDNRLIAPPALGELVRDHPGMAHRDTNSLGATWQIWGHKNELHPDEGQVDSQPFLRALLGPCSHSAGKANPWEFKNKQLEAAVKQGAYSMDAAQFDELIQNMSQLVETGEVSDDLASQVIYQLVAELAKAQPAHSQRRGVREGAPPAAQLRGATGRVPQGLEAGNSGKLTFPPRGPVLLRHSQPTSISLNKTVNSRIGNTVYITKRTEVINILCEPVTPSQATLTWTKDGALLKPSAKIILDGMGKMQIRNPTRKEQGVYGCSIANHLGSDVESSSVLYAEAPAILSVERNASRLEHGRLSVVVGGTVEAALRADVTIRCPVTGVPQPNITWLKREGPLSDNVSLLFNGSLLLQNVSLENEGTYVCTATNPLGKATATSTLHLLEQRWLDSKRGFPKDHRKHRLQASNTGTSNRPGPFPVSPEMVCVSGGRGEQEGKILTLKEGCPVLRAAPVRPDLPSEPSLPPQCPSAQDLGPTARGSSQGRLSRTVLVLQCPARCLGRTVRTPQRRAACRGHNSSDSGCDDRRRPTSKGNCSSAACAACWRPGPWRPCSAACGGGVQSRRVDCVHARSCRPVAETRCVRGRKPASWRHCSLTVCLALCFYLFL